jgi:hypothetical protein
LMKTVTFVDGKAVEIREVPWNHGH